MTDWKSKVIQSLSERRCAYLENGNKIVEDAQTTFERLDKVDQAPTGKEWNSYSSLLAQLAASITSGTVKPSALETTSDEFEKLGRNASSATKVLCQFAIAIITTLAEDYQRSAITLYRSAESEPEIASQVIPIDLFLDDYQDIITRNYIRLLRNQKSHSEILSAIRTKRIKSIFTWIVRLAIIAPLNFVLALSSGRTRGHRRTRSSDGQQMTYAYRMRMFDQKTEVAGWRVTRDELVKEHQLDDQVKRLTVIYKNHLVTITLEAKSRRRELESDLFLRSRSK